MHRYTSYWLYDYIPLANPNTRGKVLIVTTAISFKVVLGQAPG